MAKINVYLPSDLKTRMDAAERNWSKIAQEAFEAELTRLETQADEKAKRHARLADMSASVRQYDSGVVLADNKGVKTRRMLK